MGEGDERQAEVALAQQLYSCVLVRTMEGRILMEERLEGAKAIHDGHSRWKELWEGPWAAKMVRASCSRSFDGRFLGEIIVPNELREPT